MTFVGETKEFMILVVIVSETIQVATSAKVCSWDRFTSGRVVDIVDETVVVQVVIVFIMEGIKGVIGRTTEILKIININQGSF